ncbi:integrase core domain-containing protein, partial [Corynebacterium sp. MSK041]|uniref:integrase core domain-containing protein n=1 Tax=Corynebacterium sp. MSK041 TaxID=3050194 RepID=UPI00254B6F67
PLQYRVRGTPVPTTRTHGTNYPESTLIHRRAWADVVDVEIATFEWVNWWNEIRLHQSLGYRTPAEVEAELWETNPAQEIMEIKANA